VKKVLLELWRKIALDGIPGSSNLRYVAKEGFGVLEE